MSNLHEINSVIAIEEWILSSLFFPAYSSKTILGALEIIVLPAPSYDLHQQLFFDKFHFFNF